MSDTKIFNLGMDENVLREGKANFFKTERVAIGGFLYITDKRVAFCSRTFLQTLIVLIFFPALLFLKPKKVIVEIPIQEIKSCRKQEKKAGMGIRTKTLLLATTDSVERQFVVTKLDEWVRDIKNGFTKIFDVEASAEELIFNAKLSA